MVEDERDVRGTTWHADQVRQLRALSPVGAEEFANAAQGYLAHKKPPPP